MLTSTYAAVAAVAAFCVLWPASARADGDKPGATENSLINISTPDILAPRQIGARVDARVFGGDEDTTYLGVGIRYGLSSNWEIGVGSSLAQFKSFTLPGGGTVRHAGTDVELTAKYATHQSNKFGLSGQVGVGLPNTPAQKSAHLTLGITGSMSASSAADLYVNPRVVMINNNSILGLGLGARVKLIKQISLLADYTPILTGANTIDATTGTQRSHDVYGAALRYSISSGNVAVDLGWTNGTGFTTGSSLTPGLGNSSAFYLALNIKR